MSELDTNTREVPAEWLDVPEIKEATELAEEAAYTEAELEAYEKCGFSGFFIFRTLQRSP
jgi:hypothetical protein